MPVDGNWNIVVDTPRGDLAVALDLKTAGDNVSGTATSDDGVFNIEDGSVKGDELNFTVHVKKPVPMKLKYNITVAGDTMTGKAKAGIFPASKLTGNRA